MRRRRPANRRYGIDALIDDRELIESCLRGEQPGWNRFVERFGRLVYSIPRRLNMPPGDCDDVFQRVFMIVLRELPQVRDHARVSAWLIRTTYRECWRTRKKHAPLAELAGDIASGEEPSAEQLDRWERQARVHAAIAELDERCRLIVQRLFFDPGEASYEQLAAELGVPVGSVGPTRGRCLRKLESLLKDAGL